MGHYKSNIRDLEFNLFEVFGRREILGTGRYAELDEDIVRSMLDELNRMATGVLADSFEEGDRTPPVFDAATGTVKMPEGIKKSFFAMRDAGWTNLDLPAEMGGPGVPRSVAWALAELVLGSNPALWMYSSGPGFAHILHTVGNDEQKRFAELAIERQWGATMVLTEPDAGSDVGAGRAKAVQQPDGTWHIEGVKRFITSAEHDMAENIFHLVLARPEGHGPGTKGLSMFLVPKYHVDLETGELGERNGVYVTNVEKKMGLKVSTTCELTFGDKHPAVGTLVGDVHEGIKQMFMVIEQARMMVGTKAIATLSTGYLNALEYAKSRVQGADLTQMADKTAPRVTITHHPDVRRELMLQKSYAEGMRALVLLTASYQDAVQIAEFEGRRDEHAEAMNDLLLPLVKGVGSERSYEMLARSLQTLGGSGYLQEYPIEQYIRDAKIDSLYEGTTAIQGLDLFFRKVLRNQGKALGSLYTDIKAFADSEAGNGRLKQERALLAEAADEVKAMADTLAAGRSARWRSPPRSTRSA
nr:acyl-CoA dehydrogenase [Planobispora longispora]